MRRIALTSIASLLIAAASLAQNLVVPDAADLLVKTRQTVNGRGGTLDMLYIKGARQRRDGIVESAPDARRWISIVQCDERRRLVLDTKAQTYAYQPIEDPGAAKTRQKPKRTAGISTCPTRAAGPGRRRSPGSPRRASR